MNAQTVEMGAYYHHAWENQTPYQWIASYYEDMPENPVAKLAERLALESPNPVPLSDLALLLKRMGQEPDSVHSRLEDIRSMLPDAIRLFNVNYQKQYVLLPTRSVYEPIIFPQDAPLVEHIQKEKPRLHQLAQWRYEYSWTKKDTLDRHADPQEMDLLDLLMATFPRNAYNYSIDEQMNIHPNQRNIIISRLRHSLAGFEGHPVSITHKHSIIALEVP